MKLLVGYLRRHWKLGALALFLAAVNQVFSLLDPLIFRHVIDRYATRYQEYTASEFMRGVGLLLLAAVGVAFVSRVAKNFQDYCVNVIVQRLGARLYADEACFTELGPDRDCQEGGWEEAVTAPEHAALCAVPTIP